MAICSPETADIALALVITWIIIRALIPPGRSVQMNCTFKNSFKNRQRTEASGNGLIKIAGGCALAYFLFM